MTTRRRVLVGVALLAVVVPSAGRAYTDRELAMCRRAPAQAGKPEDLDRVYAPQSPGCLTGVGGACIRTMRDYWMAACLNKLWRWDHGAD
jgi:hypothetical protein